MVRHVQLTIPEARAPPLLAVLEANEHVAWEFFFFFFVDKIMFFLVLVLVLRALAEIERPLWIWLPFFYVFGSRMKFKAGAGLCLFFEEASSSIDCIRVPL
jgi:hypothetical protein